MTAPGATQQEYFSALESAVAEMVLHFGRMPDLYLHERDLCADLYAHLRDIEPLTQGYPTKDGRRTILLHCAYPAIYAPESISEGSDIWCYPIVILNPAFVRQHELPALFPGGLDRKALRALPEGARIKPAQSVFDVCLLDRLSSSVLRRLARVMERMARAHADAEACYLAVLLRHWEHDDQRERLLEALETWADMHPRVSLVYAQSYRDNLGRLFGGRYLNHWSEMAPLLPLESAQRLKQQRSGIRPNYPGERGG